MPKKGYPIGSARGCSLLPQKRSVHTRTATASVQSLFVRDDVTAEDRGRPPSAHASSVSFNYKKTVTTVCSRQRAVWRMDARPDHQWLQRTFFGNSGTQSRWPSSINTRLPQRSQHNKQCHFLHTGSLLWRDGSLGQPDRCGWCRRTVPSDLLPEYF